MSDSDRKFGIRIDLLSFGVQSPAMEICFNLTPCEETGGYVARWDDPAGGGISTQGDSFADLDQMVRDAVEGYFADRTMPDRIRLHFVRDPELAIA